MNENFPSFTALYVAYARALATHDPVLSRACVDPYAEQLLPRPLARLCVRAGRRPTLLHALETLTFGLSKHLALRTALIDRALEQALAEGVDQLVVLGAGFDARAHRLAALANATVYEVDHPATQRMKRKRAATLPVRARALHYVACNFEHGGLERALARAGFSAARRSLFLWEGVTMYLPRESVAASLAAIAALSAEQSVLIATYLTPHLVHGGAQLARGAARLLGLVAEPIRFHAPPSELAALLAQHGFQMLSDASPRDVAPHFGVDLAALTPFMPSERINVAIRRVSQT